MGPVLCLLAGLKVYAEIRQDRVLHSREVTLAEGRFRVRSPADFVTEVRDVPYGLGESPNVVSTPWVLRWASR